MIVYRIRALGHFDKFVRTKKDASDRVTKWREDYDILEIDSNDDVLGIKVDKFNIPIDKEGLVNWLNGHYAC